MTILHFKQKEEIEKEDNTLTHISIKIDGNRFVTTEERGVTQVINTLRSTDDLLEYLKVRLGGGNE